MTVRAQKAEKLPQNIPPADYITWARQSGIEIGSDLVAAVEARKRAVSYSPDDPLHPKKINSLLTMLLGLVKVSYPDAPKPGEKWPTKEIVDDLVRVGLPLDDATVLSNLNSHMKSSGTDYRSPKRRLNRIRLSANRIRPKDAEATLLCSPSFKKTMESRVINRKEFSDIGFVRLSSILAPTGPIPVSKSTWWAGVKAGRFPKPVKLGTRITAWRAKDILALLEGDLQSGGRS